MEKAHIGQDELVRQLAGTFGKIKVGATYQHYKSQDKLYTVTGLAFLEANDELCVLYRAEYGQRITFVRPLTSWLETVEWQGQQVKRFTIIN